MIVALCGMMGCGKTTVSKIIAQKYGVPFVDTDEVIVSRYGSINGIFDNYGEEYFRNIEEQVIAEVCNKKGDLIVSLGGGAVLRKQNVLTLKICGKIVYLRTKVENLVKRLENSTERPLLRGTMPDRISQILAQRASIYENSADRVIDTDGLTPSEIATIIGEALL